MDISLLGQTLQIKETVTPQQYTSLIQSNTRTFNSSSILCFLDRENKGLRIPRPESGETKATGSSLL